MGSRIINDMTVWLLSVASLMEGLASRLSFPRIRLHVCITRAIVHALDTFPRINWPRNYEMCRFQRATMGREAKRTERERGGSAFVHIRPSRYDPERIRRIPRIHYARVTPVHRVCHACCTVACNLPRVLPPPLPPRIFLRQEANGSAFVHTSWTCTCRPDVYTTRLPFPSSFVNI